MDISNILKFLPLLFSNGSDLKNGNIFESILPLLGLDGEALENIILAVNRLIAGDISLNALFPVVLPIVSNYLLSKKTVPENVSETVDGFQTNLKLEPIEEFASQAIYSSLNDYFDSDTAS